VFTGHFCRLNSVFLIGTALFCAFFYAIFLWF
jgi:hypothetical protein